MKPNSTALTIRCSTCGRFVAEKDGRPVPHWEYGVADKWGCPGGQS